ncbi:hypothetical protein [Floridanema aerugineum]|uniref:Uncharacterized protein n=1 Tax=Floridaenema aerugineum BLCC-F46 TaxID=3153654 RepID=A0ABV4X6I4_9CYAN
MSENDGLNIPETQAVISDSITWLNLGIFKYLILLKERAIAFVWKKAIA